MYHWLQQNFLSPMHFYQNSKWLLWILFVVFFPLVTYGLIGGLYLAPADYQQGDGFRIIYVHVPSAFIAMMAYLTMAASALITLVWRLKISSIAMISSAKIGIWFTFLALVTGSIWGKPMWGTWWIWDARLTSVLILFFLYLGFLALHNLLPQGNQNDKACALISLVGVINLPIIHYSVIWWNTLHQGPSISQFAKPTIANAMLYPLLAMIIAFGLLFFIFLIMRMRNLILLRERHAQWVRNL